MNSAGQRSAFPFEKRLVSVVAGPFANPFAPPAGVTSAAENSELSWPRSARGISRTVSRLGAICCDGDGVGAGATAAVLTCTVDEVEGETVGGASRVA